MFHFAILSIIARCSLLGHVCSRCWQCLSHFIMSPALRDQQTLRELFHWFLVLGLTASYVKGYRSLRALPHSRRVQGVIFAFAGTFLLVSMLTSEFHSTDVRCYVNFGWMQSQYHQNPYAVTVRQIPGWREDPMFYPEWLNVPVPYRFVFSWLAAKICQLGNGVYWATILLFKTLNVGVVVLTAVVLWLGCRDLGVPNPATRPVPVPLESPALDPRDCQRAQRRAHGFFYSGRAVSRRSRELLPRPADIDAGGPREIRLRSHPAVRGPLSGEKTRMGAGPRPALPEPWQFWSSSRYPTLEVIFSYGDRLRT